MLESIKWKGPVQVNGIEYDSIDQALLSLKGFKGKLCVVFKEYRKPRETIREQVCQHDIRISVRQYMINPPTSTFDFHERWNGGIPMPEKTMVGRIIQDNGGMYEMELRSENNPEVSWRGWVIKSAILEQEEL